MISLADSRRIIAAVAFLAGSALLGQQAQFQGSVPTGVASPTPLSLTLRDAIDRGPKANLGLLLSGQASETARGERLRSLSALLPQATGEVSEDVQQTIAASIMFLLSFIAQERSQGWQRSGCGLAKLFREAVE